MADELKPFHQGEPRKDVDHHVRDMLRSLIDECGVEEVLEAVAAQVSCYAEARQDEDLTDDQRRVVEMYFGLYDKVLSAMGRKPDDFSR